ncbi:MAG: HNH endonuclease [Ferrimicrobium sp.]
MKRPCLTCGIKYSEKSRCDTCQSTWDLDHPKIKTAIRGYGSRWQRIRKNQLDRLPVCERCGSESDLTVDHIIPLARGGSHDIDNLQTLCRSCNSSKGKR